MVAAVGVLLLGVLVPPSAQAAGPFRIVNREVAWCLDSNAAGAVYINPCGAGNRHQQWETWRGGWARNVATGRCLAQASTSGRSDAITVSPCADHPSQLWVDWQGGWFQRPAAASWSSAPGCLGRSFDAHDVSVYGCGSPTHVDPPLNWYLHPPL